jgi:hypothetical protein
MDAKEQQALERDIADIDRRRAELEMVIGARPPDCRAELEDELAGLWRLRRALAEQLRPRRTLRRA